MALRLQLLVLGVLALHGLSGPAHAQLFAGQGAALAYIPFKNGAVGVVTGTAPGGFTVQVGGTSGPRSMTFTHGAGWHAPGTPAPAANQPNAPRLRISSTKFWYTAATQGARIAAPLLSAAGLILAPTPLGDGTACSGMGTATDTCMAFGVQRCQTIVSGSDLWIQRGQCVTPATSFSILQDGPFNGGFFVWREPKLSISHETSVSGFPLEDHPSKVTARRFTKWAYGHGGAGLPAHMAKTDCISGAVYTCPDPAIEEEQQEPAIAPILPPSETPAEWSVPPAARPMPDIWEPVDVPAEWQGVPAQEMNPYGKPAPAYFADPVSQPAPQPGPSWVPVGSPATATNPAPVVNVTVDFPAQMDVNVLDFPPLLPSGVEAEPPIPVTDWAVPSLDWGGPWLPDACPAPEMVQMMGAAIPVKYDPLCNLAVQISGVFIAIALFGGVRFAVTAIG